MLVDRDRFGGGISNRVVWGEKEAVGAENAALPKRCRRSFLTLPPQSKSGWAAGGECDGGGWWGG